VQKLQAIYTHPVLPSLESVNWRSFLARPRLPSPDVEVFDTLYRQPILITGAGGSIGSALALRVAVLTPPALLLLESSESHLYALNRAWAAAGTACFMTPILGSAADVALVEHIFATHRPRIVFHAAAYKHVPLMEEQPLAAIANNIFATETLAMAAAANGARLILLSTDKAVEPASIMGATKRVAEQIVLASGGTVLRLGNVLASRDSVVELFAQQIAQGGPVTVTDPAARRYFLTLDEAVNLLLIAAALPGTPALLAPVLPAPHYVSDLAHFLIRELAPDQEIEIDFTAARPGDKTAELLWSSGDAAQPILSGASSQAPAIVSIQASQLPHAQLASGLENLRAALHARNLAATLLHLRSLVPDYTPSPSVLALAQQQGSRVSL
jgi:FlaA1/EpsC-like NDP-sugar epimerase